MSERRVDYAVLVDQEFKARRAGIETTRETANLVLKLIHKRLEEQGDTLSSADLANMASALGSCAEIIIMCERLANASKR